MNVIIPMGGVGSRFSRDGYRFPKPLVNIVGRPMLFWLLDHLTGLTRHDTLWVALSAQLEQQFGLVQRLRTEYAHLDIRAVLLTFDTRGAAETLYTVLQSMTEQELGRRTISLDCDTIYFDPVLERFRAVPAGRHVSFYFEDDGGKAIFSYLHIDDSAEQRITAVREKVMISTHANTGAYAFASAAILKAYCAAILDEAVGAVGEYYTTNIISRMIDDGQFFTALRVHTSDFTCVGTPAQLQQLLTQLKQRSSSTRVADNSLASAGEERLPARATSQSTSQSTSPSSPAVSVPAQGGTDKFRVQANRRMRFCFDLDNTLVTYPRVAKDYSSVLPIERNIQLVRELHAAGHYIIIQTARRMKTHQGNVGAVIADIGQTTLATLDRFGIPYNELLFGKPYADVYVDDLAVHALLDTAKEIGWALDSVQDSDQQQQTSASTSGHKPIKGFVAARHFNTLQEVDNTVVKSAASELLLGEVYYYLHVPDDVADLFPPLQRVEHNLVQAPLESPSAAPAKQQQRAQSVSSLFIDKIAGVTFSHLYVNRALTGGRLQKLLTALYRLHSSNGLRAGQPAVPQHLASALLSAYDRQEESKQAEHSADGVDVDIYDNYALKMSARYKEHRELYRALEASIASAGPGAPASATGSVAAIYERLYDWFLEFARSGRGVRSLVIHGDPVFSNALLSAQGQVTLIDMRGRLGDVLTVMGDAVYDLGKVYQSIDGYDFILHDLALTSIDQRHSQQLQAVFDSFVQSHYPTVRISDVQAAAALLYFSLIPLHNNTAHQRQFLARSLQLAEKAREQARGEARTRTSSI